MTRWALLVLLALVPACFDAHGLDGDAGSAVADGGGSADDGGTTADGEVRADSGPVCETTCGSTAVLARIELDVERNKVPALLDLVVHRDELVAALAIGPMSSGPDPGQFFSLARISRRDGAAEVVPVPIRVRVSSICAGALVSSGERLTLIAAHGAGEFHIEDDDPQVSVATWEGPASTPGVASFDLTDVPLPVCLGCRRRGASVAVDGDEALVLLTDDARLLVGRVQLATPTLTREVIALDGLSPTIAIDARSNRRGSALVALGGTREIAGADPAPASALLAERLDAPIAIPGTESDSTPYPWVLADRIDVVRFIRDDASARGALRRYRIEASDVVERERIATAGGLPPLAIASAGPVLVWAESSLSEAGESDIRALARTSACSEVETPITVAHVETPLGTGDPRVLAATEADGRTYVALVEQEPELPHRAFLTVLDLGVCSGD